MDFTGNMLWLLILAPAGLALLNMLAPSPRFALAAVAWGVPLLAVAGGWAALTVYRSGVLLSAGAWLHLDALAAYHLLIMLAVFALSSLYVPCYFRHEPAGHALQRADARRFAALWYATLSAMTLVMLSNNLGIMWVGVEATTLLTAFLICLHVSPVSLEATWKYLIVCSVGVAFAFMGVLLTAAAAEPAIAGPAAVDAHLLHWTNMRSLAVSLDIKLLKPAFIFLLVGYGAKAGLAPMHGWLPDAHSQAPAPVSAVFSGFMLNMALYCIMRYLPLMDAAGGAVWTSNLLVTFGLISILIAAVFIVAQQNLKRFLAFCSVEHLGIITLGLGLGPLGVFAALFHVFNHSICKALGFFCAGRIGQIYGTQDMRQIRDGMRINPLWGGGLFGSILALIGVVPFAIFFSELLILKAAAESGRYVVMAVFLLGIGTVFVGALRHAMNMFWGAADFAVDRPRNTLIERLIVIGPLFLLLMLGLWMPSAFQKMLAAAAYVLTGSGAL